MASHRSEGFFEALFGFKEREYAFTRHRLFGLCNFTTQTLDGASGGSGLLKERALFQRVTQDGQCGDTISSGWHSTPSVAELRAETAALVQRFEAQQPGLLDALRRTVTSATPHANMCDATAAPLSAAAGSWVRGAHTQGEGGALHLRHAGALFQVASQFNLLEFISPEVTPESGVTHYVYDRTQGPACALACMAGTAYRNYLLHPGFFHKPSAASGATVGEQERGQQSANQLNMLSDFTHYLTQAHGSGSAGGGGAPALPLDHFYAIRNGYFFPAPAMGGFTQRLEAMAAEQRTSRASVEDSLISRLRIGLVEDATVTLPLHSAIPPLRREGLHEVSQTYNSALSLPRRGGCGAESWASLEALSRIILRGTYEATLLAGVQHTLRHLEAQAVLMSSGDVSSTSSRAEALMKALPPIFLTKVGGGVFNNDAAWIAEAIGTAMERVEALGVPLDVRLVHYHVAEPEYVKAFPTWPTVHSD